VRRVAFLALLATCLTACSGSTARVSLPAMRPPAASTWPKAPSYPPASCWTRNTSGGIEAYAPQYLPRATGSQDPNVILRRLLRAFGDRLIVKSASLGPRPRKTRIHHGYFPTNRPPTDGVWLYVDAPAALQGPTPRPDAQRAEWEVSLLAGGLRDALCLARSRPLIAWSTTGGVGAAGFSDDYQPFGQHFPNPSPAAFRRRVDAVARAYRLRVVSVRLLHPFQLAPVVILQATDRKASVRQAAKIDELLDPTRGAAQTFEGFYLELRDAKSAFVRMAKSFRGQAMGSQWAWDPCYLPYAHSEPYGAKPYPKGTPGGG
jgi:hypothetical protein